MATTNAIPHDRYWATVTAKEIASQIQGRREEFRSRLEDTGRLGVMQRAIASYYGQDAEGGWKNSSVLQYGGEQGELVMCKANHFRSLVQHILVMTTTDRPAFDARAGNTDVESQAQTMLAEALLEYYMTEHNGEDKVLRAAELAVVVSEGWVTVTWDHSAGEDFAAEMQEETEEGEDPYQGRVVKSGDLRIEFHAPWDVARNLEQEPENQQWVIVRRPANRWDLAAVYAGEDEDLRTQILRAGETEDNGTGSDLWERWDQNNTDTVHVNELYHARTPAVPNGRHTAIVGDVVLFDGPLPYSHVPAFAMLPSVEMGQGAGYSSSWDLLGLQDVYDSVISTAVTNHDAFGVQNILIPNGSNLQVDDLAGGLRALRYTPDPSGAKVEPLQLLRIDGSTFKLADLVRGELEVLSGVNKVARGEPPSNLKSGSALALVQAMAMQFNSGMQRAYVRLLEQMGSGMVRVLQQFAHTPRVVEIVGKDKRSMVREFVGKDISAVRRVVVDVGNPLMRSTAGKLELANSFLEKELVKNIDQYYQVLETGRAEPITQRATSQLMNIKSENERLLDGQPVKTLVTDLHALHIEEHLSVLDSPEVRENDQVSGNALAHITEHQEMAMGMDPTLAELTGQRVLETMAAPPPPGPGMGPEMGPGEPMPPEGGVPPEMMGEGGPAPTADVSINGEQPANMPIMPQNPMTGERAQPGGM